MGRRVYQGGVRHRGRQPHQGDVQLLPQRPPHPAAQGRTQMSDSNSEALGGERRVTGGVQNPGQKRGT